VRCPTADYSPNKHFTKESALPKGRADFKSHPLPVSCKETAGLGGSRVVL